MVTGGYIQRFLPLSFRSGSLRRICLTLKMKGLGSFETSVTMYQSTRPRTTEHFTFQATVCPSPQQPYCVCDTISLKETTCLYPVSGLKIYGDIPLFPKGPSWRLDELCSWETLLLSLLNTK
jgi:hypothetical protein